MWRGKADLDAANPCRRRSSYIRYSGSLRRGGMISTANQITVGKRRLPTMRPQRQRMIEEED
jgi:hypothetical protein